MLKADIVKGVAAACGAPVTVAEDYVDATISVITTALAAEDAVELHPLGRFLKVNEPEHAGTDPITHTPIQIPASNRVLFHPAQELRDAVNA